MQKRSRDSEFTEECYSIGDDHFVKRLWHNGQASFYMNGRELTLGEWNVEVNRRQPMSARDSHPNPLIRSLESQRRRSFLAMVKTLPQDVVADVGAERGYFASHLTKRCHQVLCVDIDANMLTLARQSLANDNVLYVQADIQSIGLQDSSVDVTVAAHVLEHVPNPAAALKELVRITRPRGRIYIQVPNEPLILWVKKALSQLRLQRIYHTGLSEQQAIGHLTVFNKTSLARICSGLTEIRTLCYTRPFFLAIFAELVPLKDRHN